MSVHSLSYQSVSALPYEKFMEGRYQSLDTVRLTKNWEICSAWIDAIPVLFLAEHDIRRVVLFRY